MLEELRELHRLEQVVMEDNYDRRKIRKHVRNQIGEDTPFYNDLKFKIENICIQEGLAFSPTDLTTELLLTTLIVNRAPLQSVVANLAINMDIDDKDYLDTIDKFTTLIIDVAGIVYDVIITKADALVVLPKLRLDDELQKYVACKKYLPPLRTVPKPWSGNTGGGYLTRTESVILGKLNHHNEKQALDALNILQAIPLELDLAALEHYEEPEDELSGSAQKQFNQLVEESDIVYEETLNNDNEFYFKWNFDMRGRMYSAGYHINIQGTPYKRSIINFKRKEVINDAEI